MFAWEGDSPFLPCFEFSTSDWAVSLVLHSNVRHGPERSRPPGTEPLPVVVLETPERGKVLVLALALHAVGAVLELVVVGVVAARVLQDQAPVARLRRVRLVPCGLSRLRLFGRFGTQRDYGAVFAPECEVLLRDLWHN